jgi:hypothetical protein
MPTSEPACNKDPLTGICTGILYSYDVVAESAYVAFDRAITYAQTTANPGSTGFPIPDTWMPSPDVTWDVTNFVKIIRSYRARIRANVARRSSETVDWAAVVADAQNGLGKDYFVNVQTGSGIGISWRQQYDAFDTWHQMPPFIIGMADTSGSYANWISQPLSARGSGNVGFFMITPDLRFPQGATRSDQQADAVITNTATNSCGQNTGGQACRRYFYNRPTGNDVFSGQGWGWSNYGFIRFHSWVVRGDGGTARIGKTPLMMKAEMDLLQAEGLYRLGGNDAQVAALINNTRTAGMGTSTIGACTNTCATGGGLPAVLPLRTSAATGTLATGCVPRIPTGPTGPLACGDLLEALKYEKRLETAYTHYLSWYLDSRRWDERPKDTPLWWPVPFQDLQARGRPVEALYGTGLGAGNAPNSTAPGSAYGW